MPVMSRKYCKSTPISRMGFSQKASCKAQGYIARTSKKYKGKLIKSLKYRMNKSLYSSGNKKPKVKTGYSRSSSSFRGYGDVERAKMTLKNIKGMNKDYQIRVVNTMYNRAKFHKNQTKDMREAMKVFRNWLKKYKSKNK